MSGGCPRDVAVGTQSEAIAVLFADEHLVVVDKPAGMPSVPARTPLDPPCVAAVLAGRFGRLEPVHRLDRDTSGILVLARSPVVRAVVGRSFERRDVEKRYEGVVQGRPPRPEGEIRLPLARDPDRPPRYRVDPIMGREATTRWRLWATARASDGGERSWLELEPVTGRSHQLRVHLAWLGIPITGDRLYGRHPVVDDVPLALRAIWIRLPHPRDGRPLELSVAPHPRTPRPGQSSRGDCGVVLGPVGSRAEGPAFCQ